MKRRSLLSFLLVRIGIPVVTLITLGFVADSATAGGRHDSKQRAPVAAKKRSHRAVVEVVQTRDGRTYKALSATVQVLSESRPSRVELTGDRARCRIALSVEREKKAALVRLDLRWSEHSRPAGKKKGGKVASAEVSLSSRVAVGKRVLLGRFSQASGAEYMVYLTLS